MAIPLRISCQTPMLCAFAATGLLYWVVNFQESTRISRILFIRARRGARGKDATKRVMNPNWMTAREKRKMPKSAPSAKMCPCKSILRVTMKHASCHSQTNGKLLPGCRTSHLQTWPELSDNLPQPQDTSLVSYGCHSAAPKGTGHLGLAKWCCQQCWILILSWCCSSPLVNGI